MIQGNGETFYKRSDSIAAPALYMHICDAYGISPGATRERQSINANIDMWVA